jgi:tetratricopeptide (TPR) repeat protein
MSSDVGTPYAGERIDEAATRSPACPACGRHSQPEAAFCAFCGTALVHQRVPGPPVFAAVATAIDGRTAYEVLAEVGALFESLGAVFEGVSRSPATLVALFPPREDAAAVAARAALDAAGRCPSAKLGIDASEVTERSDQDAIWQDLIDRSAELGALAEPGTIVASEAIPPLTEGAAVVDPIGGSAGAIWLRGMRDIVAIDAIPPQPHEPEPAATAPFVGREAELAQLRRWFDEVRAEGRAACVAVVGEPGSGTSRLAGTFVGSIDDAKVFEVRCGPGVDGGTWPLAPLVEAFAGVSPRDEPDEVRARLERLLADVPDADRILRRVAHLLAIDGGEALADETRWAVRATIEAAVLGPSILLIDDVDQAAFGFGAFLADVARALPRTPLLIVCTARSEPVGVPDTIVVGGLDDTSARAIVASMLGEVDPAVVTSIVTSFGGSPLLLEQGIAALVERSSLVLEDGRWTATDEPPIPGTANVRDVVAERLERLPGDVRTAAALAAACGAVIERDVIDREGIEGHLATLAAMGFLVAEDDGRFRWSHGAGRVAGAGGPPAAAEILSRLARRELERAGARRWRHAASAGSRFADAVDEAGDAASDEDRAQAVELLRWAAGRAADQGDGDGAASLERRASRVLPADDPRRAELSFSTAWHVSATARVAESEAAIDDAIAATVAVPGDAVDHHVRVLRASIRAAVDRATLDAARAVADEAYERFAQLDDPWGRSRAAALRGQVHAARGHAAATFEDFLEAAELARAAERPADAAAALRGAGRALLDGPAPVEEALDRSAELRDAAAGYPLAEHDLAGVHALLLARRARIDESRELIDATIAGVESLVADADLAVALHRSGVIWWLAGEFHAAEPPIQRALAAAALARDDRLRARIAASWANLVLATEDRVDEAIALADVAETWGTDPAARVGWRTARARALVRIGDVETADRLGRQAVSLAEQTDSTDLRANALLHLAEVLRLSGRPAEAGPFERRAFRLLDRKGATAQAAAIFRQLGDDDPPATKATSDEDRAEATLGDGDPELPISAEPMDVSTEDGPIEHEPDREARSPDVVVEPDDVPSASEDAREENPPVEPTPSELASPAPAQPIADAFAASSDGDQKRKGLFRR